MSRFFVIWKESCCSVERVVYEFWRIYLLIGKWSCSSIEGLLWFSHYSEFKILIPNVQLSKAFAPCALWRNKRQHFLASEQQFISSVQSWKLVLKHELNVWKEEKKERKNTDSSVQDRHSCLVSDSLGPGPRSAEVFIIAEDSNYSTVLLLNSQVRDEIQESKP